MDPKIKDSYFKDISTGYDNFAWDRRDVEECQICFSIVLPHRNVEHLRWHIENDINGKKYEKMRQ